MRGAVLFSSRKEAGKALGFAWYTIMQPAWLWGPSPVVRVINFLDNLGDEHIPGFKEGSLLGYDFATRFTGDRENMEKLKENNEDISTLLRQVSSLPRMERRRSALRENAALRQRTS